MKILLTICKATCIIAFLCFLSCGDKNESNDSSSPGTPYDPNKPITLTSFYPDSGFMATQVILEGNNFGNLEKEVKVYFNKKRAAVVRTTGDMIYAITPRQPGDVCTISVVVGKDSITYDKHFRYYTSVTVSTITGVPGSTEKRTGTLSEASFTEPKYLTVDKEKNIYLLDWPDANKTNGQFLLVNEKNNLVMAIANNMPKYNVPCIDPTETKILLPADAGLGYVEYNMLTQYSQRKINPQKIGSDWAIQYKHSLAPCAVDGMVYTVGRYEAYILQINPNTKECKMVKDIVQDKAWYYLAFNPLEPHMLYMSLYQLHCICRYNVLTGDYELYAGKKNTAGHADGEKNDALFNSPLQISFDYDGNLFVADEKNHCIRKIAPDGIVSTVIGIPGKSGYIDGGPDYALFNSPAGVTVDRDNIVYIADTGNDCLRKLAIE